ncbi:MAG: ParB/RepB/Spo0J family partition protein [Patescibacteria group bacterium]
MNNKNSGLGRGLSSLIPSRKIKNDFSEDEELVQTVSGREEKITSLPLDKIFPNPNQPRSSFDEEALEELAQSIREQGVLQPIIVAPFSGEKWQVVAGERRLKASKKAGLSTIPAIIRDFDEQKKMEVALIENLQREDLSPLDQARSYRALLAQFNLSELELAKKVGKSQSAISNTMRLLKAVGEVKDALAEGKVTGGHAKAIVGLPESDQREVLSKIINEKWDVRRTEREGHDIVARKKIRKLWPVDPEVRAKQEELEKILSTKVEIREHNGAGQITIRFFSTEEFQEIVRKIVE